MQGLEDVIYPVTDEDEIAQAERLARWLDEIKTIEERSSRLARVSAQPKSQMAADDRATNPLQIGHMVSYCLLVAEDNLRSIRLLVRPDDLNMTLPIVACFPLVRTCLESAAQAVWLMAPIDQKERIIRLLIARRSDYLFDRDLVNIFNQPAPNETHEQRSSRAAMVREQRKNDKVKRGYLQSIARLNGIESSDYEVPMPGYRSITFDAGVHSGLAGNMVKGVWHYISGLTHPSVARGVDATQLQDLQTVHDNVMSGRMVADIGRLNLGLMTAVHLFRHADRLRRRMMLQPAT